MSEDSSRSPVRAGLTGVPKSDLQAARSSGVLIINAEPEAEEAQKEGRRLRRERRYGHDVRSSRLSSVAEARNIKAKITDGVPDLTVPKPSEVEAHSISIG